MDGDFYKTNEEISFYGNSKSLLVEESFKECFVKYDANENEVNELSFKGILDNPEEYFRIRDIAINNGFSVIREIGISIKVREQREVLQKELEEGTISKEEFDQQMEELEKW